MSESDFEFEDEAQDQAARKDPVRARMRELEQQVKAFEARGLSRLVSDCDVG